MNNDETWEEVDIPENEETSYEIEEEQVEPQQAKPVQEEEQPQELDGIKTKGAEKRIRQLVRQRKERDEQIAQLLAQNE